MGADELPFLIRREALKLGYDECGIVPIVEIDGYTEKLEERIALYPESEAMYGALKGFAQIGKKLPWVKSVVICVEWYGNYRIPENLKGMYGKSYLTDSRRDSASSGFKSSAAFEGYLKKLGLQTFVERNYGITAMRWMATKAGLGIIRKNNFFYTEKGSWIHFEAWLIDRELELKGTAELKKCPENCSLCVKSCPTRSLAAPFTMNPISCVSFLTTKAACGPGKQPYDKTGTWLYGCDSCQDACPFNRRSWTDDVEFPGLDELAEHLSPEQLIDMDYASLRSMVASKFWYVEPQEAWKFKVNALNVLRNTYSETHLPCIKLALRDESVEVREMAQWVLNTVATPE